jgi:hypothetical protein
MPTILERDIQNDSNVSSSMTAVVLIIAFLVLAGIAMYVLRIDPFSTHLLAEESATIPPVNVSVNGFLPGTNP